MSLSCFLACIGCTGYLFSIVAMGVVCGMSDMDKKLESWFVRWMCFNVFSFFLFFFCICNHPKSDSTETKISTESVVKTN